MPRYAMLIETDKCLGCHTCAVTCRSEWGIEPPGGRCVVREILPAGDDPPTARASYVGLCGHCRQPACVAACPVPPEIKTFTDRGGQVRMIRVAATWKDPFTGLVAIDDKRCTGCGACVRACPYRARYLRPRQGRKVADACSFCAPRLARGETPACVANCLAGAMRFGDLDDPASPVARAVAEGARPLPSLGPETGINLYYSGRSPDLDLLRRHVPALLRELGQEGA